MFTIESDATRNRLVIRYEGFVSAAEMRAGVPKIEAALAALRPGFQLLTDLSGLSEIEVEAAGTIKQVMDLCRQHGIARVVRAIPDPKRDIGFNIMSHFHYRRGVGIITCETLAEAQAALAAE
jgi:hypothetical protein